MSDAIRQMAAEFAPKAALVALQGYVGVANLSVPELLVEALRRLPTSGRIRRKADATALKAVGWLLDQVPEINPLRAEIDRLYQNALTRGA